MVQVRGRFAPTPSGPLHFGSLIAAIASYLNTKSQGGLWLLRIDDLDQDRNAIGATESILSTLENFGLFWDDEVLFQSEQLESYENALVQLSEKNLIYPCVCTRKQIGNNPYKGTCRENSCTVELPYSLRVFTQDKTYCFQDIKQGNFKQNIEKEIGDFIIKRADGFIAYHLANVVDDKQQGITEVIRGVDLLDSTPRQIYLQKLLGYSQPEYLHLPVAVDQKGQKLGKSNGTLAINTPDNPKTHSELICDALNFLGQNPFKDLKKENVQTCLEWGVSNWDVSKISDQKSIQYEDFS